MPGASSFHRRLPYLLQEESFLDSLHPVMFIGCSLTRGEPTVLGYVVLPVFQVPRVICNTHLYLGDASPRNCAGYWAQNDNKHICYLVDNHSLEGQRCTKTHCMMKAVLYWITYKGRIEMGKREQFHRRIYKRFLRRANQTRRKKMFCTEGKTCAIAKRRPKRKAFSS